MKNIFGKLGITALSIAVVIAGGGIKAHAETISENAIEHVDVSTEQEAIAGDLQEEVAVVASGTDTQGHVSWTLDENGLLIVNINGEYGKALKKERGISDHISEIKSIKVTGAGVGSCAELLQEFPNVTQIDLSEFDGSGITSLNSMFFDCENLESINFGNFDTSN